MQLLIADDRKLIMGSANLNDRSMWGSRDSELAVFMDAASEGRDLEITINNKTYLVNKRIHQFRCAIFTEHFGLGTKDVTFPNSAYFWAKAWNIARQNTAIYEHFFQVYPSDKYKNWSELLGSQATKETEFNKADFEIAKDHIQGHAVVYPYRFLEEENLLEAKSSLAHIGLVMLPIRALY